MAKPATKKPGKAGNIKTGDIGKGKAGPGRPKGSPNKVTADLRSMILTALDGAGGVKYLQKQADENPASFLTLIGKILPKEITGPEGGDLFPNVTVTLVRPPG